MDDGDASHIRKVIDLPQGDSGDVWLEACEFEWKERWIDGWVDVSTIWNYRKADGWHAQDIAGWMWVVGLG